MKKFLVFLVHFSVIFHYSIGDEEILCTAASCKCRLALGEPLYQVCLWYLKPVCTAVPTKCKGTDDTAGIHMLSPDICNCCDYCLVNLAEGEACSVGDPSNGKHTSICGPGLTCIQTNDQGPDGFCEKLSTPCVQAQEDYDQRREEGFLGTMESRATCDDDGLYNTYKCIPGQTCHCLRSNGSRIFGDANFNTIAEYMPCSCARKYYDAVDLQGRDLHPHEHFRCTAEGLYDRLQCINEKCLCVDSEDGAPTYPNNDLVELDKITNETLPCYTKTTPGLYYKPCEEEYMNVYKEVEAKKNESGYKFVFGYNFPKCDLDGTYAAVQENKTHKYCVDKTGNPLLALDKSDTTLKTLRDSMDCKCTRANLIMTNTEKPQCLQNGNYNPVQCRRGICRCVDADGSQKCSSATAACEEVDESQTTNLRC